MTREQDEEMLARIDAVIGPPSDETPAEHEQRVAWVERETLRRRLARVIGRVTPRG